MISLYFGLPGCGKTTLLTYYALKYIKMGVKVYGNVPLAVSGYTMIDNECVGQYQLEKCVLLIDEGTLFADSRRFKDFPSSMTNFFLLHRHYRCDVLIFTQQWDGLDKRIRVITDRVYYVYKTPFLGTWLTKFYQVPYGIIIPDPKKSDSQKLGEIVQGYCKPSLLGRIFCGWIFRPKYYKYFDSFECPKLPDLPDKYQPYE